MKRRSRLIVATTHHLRSSLQVGAQHLARHFSHAGWSVALVSAPLTPLHLLKMSAPDIAARFRAWRNPRIHEGILDLCPFTVLPVAGYGLKSRRLLGDWPRWTIPPLRRQLRCSGMLSPDVVVADSPLHWALVGMVRPARLVYRIPDFTPGFWRVPTALVRLERELVTRADLVVCATAELQDYAVSLGASDVMVLENGVDMDFVSQPAAAPLEYQRIPRPRAVYVGALQEWFDYDLIADVARRLPEVHFVIIGPRRKAKFPAALNLHVLGERSRDEVPGYLQHADVGIIPFDRANFAALVDRVHPLKLYEYFAAGLPVVSTRWPLLERLGSPALLVDGPEDFASALRAAIRSSRSTIELGRTFAAANTWGARFGLLEAALADTAHGDNRRDGGNGRSEEAR